MPPRNLQLTPEAPWPGPAAYAERDAGFFHGRKSDTAELHRLIRAEPVSVLYALSGLGKTSLLQAGVFPRLRTEGWLPVRIRLDHRDIDDSGNLVPPLPEQVLMMVTEAAQTCGVSVPDWNAREDTLTAAFHERGGRFWGAHEEEPVTPVLVFDQFEECWTLTRDRPKAPMHADALLGQIAALLDWRGNGERAPAPVRVVFALREDQIAPLDALRPLFPGLRRARLRLRQFTAAQAREIVGQGGQHLLADGAMDAIVDTFASHDPERPVADPALLSIFCWQLNENRRAEGANSITAALVSGMRGEFVRQFYEGAFAGLPHGQAYGARRFVEGDLIDAAGFRTSAGFEHAKKKYGITPSALEHLVDARLLHPVDRTGGHRHVELIHDRIAEEAARQRTQREEAEAREDAAETRRRAAAEKQALQADLATARRRALILGTFTLLAFVALGGALKMWFRARHSEDTALMEQASALEAKNRAEFAQLDAESAKKQTEDALHKAIVAKNSADELIRFMQYDLRDTLAQVGRLDMMKIINERIARYHEEHPPDAGDADSRENQGAMLHQRGDVLLSQGALAGALTAYQEAMQLFGVLAREQPNEPRWQRDLSVSCNKLGDALVASGNGKAALESYWQSLAIREQLAKQDPHNSQCQRDLSISYTKIGDALATGGDNNAALTYYQKDLTVAKRLAEQAPSNVTWQRDLSISYDRLGTALAAGGDAKSALESYRQSLAIRERLTKQDSSNVTLERGLFYSYYTISEILEKEGDLAGALSNAAAALTISEKLSVLDPTNTVWQHDVEESRTRVTQLRAALKMPK